MTANLKDREMERRLSLYQVFVSLYERHSNLLNEILQLDNIYQPSLHSVKPRYVQGVVDDSAIYVVTNLCENQTQTLQQSQHIWTIGRDRHNGIYTGDKHLSRCHAAIQYIENQGFYLVDFKSKNGSFVNGERVYQSILLKDGDRIRLGSLTCDFFLNYKCRTLPQVANDFLAQAIPEQTICASANLDETVQITLDFNYIESLKCEHNDLSLEKKSAILDRLFQRNTSLKPG
ncbi:FHA domain-containing protein [Nostoc sp. TCL26-01]|uniref:FHA domain-containing protein n=1 Tax=Nostoc sp. TCL26-01 TaxID=2576904 RepID=UPI0015B9041C|nr:FHA domain-containing protein [Nostoc sp. TCL26-01]QLE57610.1 FHA domain-containing protein [Nostoc sp. TCL26-01]